MKGGLTRFKCWACVHFGEYIVGADLTIEIGGFDFLKNNYQGLVSV